MCFYSIIGITCYYCLLFDFLSLDLENAPAFLYADFCFFKSKFQTLDCIGDKLLEIPRLDVADQ